MLDIDIYEAKIEDLTDGIIAISLVEYPAVEKDFVCFSEEKQIVKFAIDNEDKHLITGVIMLANSPIYRRQGEYEYYVLYTPETIQKMASKMLNDGTFKLNDIQHNGEYIKGLSLVELYIKDSSKGINPSFISDIPDGSLMATYHIDDDNLWDEIKNGDMLNGFSLEGLFTIDKIDKNNSKQRNTKMGIIEKIIKKAVKFAAIETDKGTLLTNEGEELAVGVEVFVEDGEGYKPAEDGEYKYEEKIIVVEGGKVAEIRDAEAEVEEPAAEVEVEAEEEPAAEVEVIEPQPEERDNYQEQIDALKGEIEALRGEIAELRNALNDFIQKPIVEPIVEEYQKVTEPKSVKGNKNAIELAKYLKK